MQQLINFWHTFYAPLVLHLAEDTTFNLPFCLLANLIRLGIARHSDLQRSSQHRDTLPSWR